MNSAPCSTPVPDPTRTSSGPKCAGAAAHPALVRNHQPHQSRPAHSSSTLRSNTSSVFYYSGGQRRRSRPFTYGFGVGGRKRKSREFQTWIRCLIVCAYLVVVSMPALLFSYYYTRVWDPTYVNRLINHYPHHSMLIQQPSQIVAENITKKTMEQKASNKKAMPVDIDGRGMLDKIIGSSWE